MIEVVKNFNSYVWRTEVLEISSDKGRRQTANLNSCYQKLDGSLMQVANDVVAKEARNHEAAVSRKDRAKDQQKAKKAAAAAASEERLRKQKLERERSRAQHSSRR
ncbi:hypothetical protein HO133_006103 [Letharia lupina]|uniref:Uncharacterized protein n=1 Tax=Letharia lupina TaxID=560253 RepID=A0A8H6C797_9LECA|nr:uncharacterized protein HO133_006103 [Letharia lupina]KAF6218144.1 hypothetical protein HO133_006103 [Letharia lupina]